MMDEHRRKAALIVTSAPQPGGSRDQLFTFTRLPPSRWRSGAHRQCDRTATRGPQAQDQNADCAAVGDPAASVCALLASGQINRRKVDGWKTLSTKPIDQQFDLAS
jgi:hypothetical protein